MDSNFGEFITKEYGLLKQILSYLKPSDLHNARLVCQEWKKAVENLVERKPIILSYKHGQKDPMPSPKTPILPNLVIYQNVRHKDYMKPPCSVCKQRFLICHCDLMGPETEVLMLNNLPLKTPYNSELYSFWQLPSIMLLSCPENIRISTFNLNSPSSKLSSHQDIIHSNELVKGIFVVCKHTQRTITQLLFSDLVNRLGLTFAIGGGVAEFFSYNYYSANGQKRECKTGGLCLIFKGRNVSAHSELIADRDEASIDKSIAKLKERVGEVSVGGTQIALIAQCIERRMEFLEELESRIFRKYFPNTPQFGFPACGEFGFKNGSSDDQGTRNKIKRKRLDFCHVYTTSIMVVTFGKP